MTTALAILAAMGILKALVFPYHGPILYDPDGSDESPIEHRAAR